MKLPFQEELKRFEVKGRIIVVAFAILFGAMIYRFDTVWGFVCKLVSLASPFIIGFAVAFLLTPLQNRIEKLMIKSTFFQKHPTFKRTISTAASLLFLIAVVVVLLWMLLPQLIQSIGSIIAFITTFLQTHKDEMNEILLKFKKIGRAHV